MSPLASLGFSGGGPVKTGLIATGGVESTYINGRYRIHTFTSSGQLVVSANPNLEWLQVLIVGGGGSGGNGSFAANYYRWSGAGGAAGGFNINNHLVTSGTVTVTVGGQTGNSSISYDGTTITAYGGPSGNTNYPNNNFAAMPTVGFPASGASDLNPYVTHMVLNITGHGGRAQAGANGIQGEAYNHWLMQAAGYFSGFGGVGAKGWDYFYNSPGLYNSGNGGAGGQSVNANGFPASGFGCGGGGGAAPSTNGTSTSGGAGSPGIVIIGYRL